MAKSNRQTPLLAIHAVTALRQFADPDIARHSQRFFKTGRGEYGQGDLFLGVRVPVVRKIATQFASMTLSQNCRLLHSRFHEARLCALIIMVKAFAQSDRDPRRQKKIYEAYLANTRYINNWDLVDTSAYQIVGGWLQNRSRAPLYRLVRSKVLWERRIAMMATAQFIMAGDFDDTIRLAEILLSDHEDLIHKITGWMLREVAKRDKPRVTQFLCKHYERVPRTTLRYAIERYPVAERKRILAGRC